MIRLDNISKQNGRQILFIEAAAALNRGEKIGLVGPNGAGKTTLFRMITGQEQPDEGQVATDRGITIGYFSQDVGDMAGHSAVAEVMNGAGPVSDVATELKELEAAMADPANTIPSARTRWTASSPVTARSRPASRNWTATHSTAAPAKSCLVSAFPRR